MNFLIACEQGHLNYLKDNLKEVNDNIICGTDLLTQAVMFNQFEIVKYLVEEHEILNDYNYSGMTSNNISGMNPFLWAIRINNMEMAHYLLDHGAEYNRQSIWDKEFTITSNNGRPTIQELLKINEITDISILQKIEKLDEVKKQKYQNKREDNIKRYIIKYKGLINLPFIPRDSEANKYSPEELRRVRDKYNL